MTRSRLLVTAILLTPLLVACASAPTQDPRPQVAAAVAGAVTGAPHLPARDDALPTASDAPLSVAGAVQEALLANPRARIALARLDAATADRIQAGLVANPVASLMALRPTGGGRVEIDAGLAEDLYDLLTRAGRVAASDAGQRRVAAETTADLVGLAQDTESAYYRLAAQRRREALAEAQASLAERERDLVHRQALAGSEGAAEALALDAALAMRAHDLGDARAETARARAALAALLGRSSAQSVQLPTEWPTLPIGDLDGTALLDLAQAHRPELRASRAALEEAQAQRALASGWARATQPTVSATAMRERDGTRAAGEGLGLSLPLLDDGRARAAAADARVAEARWADVGRRRSVPLEVETALATLAAAQVALEHAEHHLREQQRLAALADREYRTGVRDLRATLAARRSALAAEQQQVDARDSVYASWVALERATGAALMHGSDGPG